MGLESLEDRRLLATLFWDGDVSANWNDDIAGDTNWAGNVLPASGDTLVFDSLFTGNQASNNDTTSGNDYELIFSFGGFSLSGNAIDLLGINDTHNAGGTNQTAMDLNLLGDTTINVAGGAQELQVNGVLSGPSGATLTKTGAGDLAYRGFPGHTFDGTTQVNDGGLVLDQFAVDQAINGPLIIGDGIGLQNSARVRLDLSVEIANDVAVTINSDGLFDQNNNFEDFGPLTMVGGNVEQDGAGLVLNGPLDMSAGASINLGGGSLNLPFDSASVTDSSIGGGGGFSVGSNLTTSNAFISVSDIFVGGNTSIDFFSFVSANTGTFFGTVSVTNFSVLSIGTGTFFGDVDVDETSTFDLGVMDLGGQIIDFNVPSGTVVVTADIANGELVKTGAGQLILNGNGLPSFTLAAVFEGTLEVNGLFGDTHFLLDGGLLEGGGLLGSVSSTFLGGGLHPGNSPGLLTVAAFEVMNAATTFIVDINGPVPAVPFPVPIGIQMNGYSQLAVIGGPVDLDSNATLDLNFNVAPSIGNYIPSPGTQFIIIDNQGLGPVLGQFITLDGNVLDEGEIYVDPENGFVFQITYRGGDGNDVVLTAGSQIAVDDFFVMPEGLSLLDDVSLNDTVPFTGSQFVIVSQPLNGSLTLFGDGSFIYTPAVGFSGLDQWSYMIVNDGAGVPVLSNTAFVNIFVNAVNTDPEALPDFYGTNEDTLLADANLNVLANDISNDGNPLEAVLVFGTSHGQVNLAPDGTFAYLPNANWYGTDFFGYQARDTVTGLLSEVEIVTIEVWAVPEGVPDLYSVKVGSTLVVAGPGVLVNDDIIDGALFPVGLSATLVDGPQFGDLVLFADGGFVYTPHTTNKQPFFFAADAFTYIATNGINSTGPIAVQLVLIENVAPLPQPDAFVTNVRTPLVVAAPGVLGNDSDPDGEALSAFIDSQGTFGTATVNADGSFTYTPNPNLAIDAPIFDTFFYRAYDGVNVSAPIPVVVTLVNTEPPIAVEDNFSIGEDLTLIVGPTGVLSNDSDPEGDDITAILRDGTQFGQLILAPDGSFVYTPYENFVGVDTFNYWAFDGLRRSAFVTVNITVIGTPDAPTVVDHVYATPEDTLLSVPAPGVLQNATDPDGDALFAVLVNGPLHANPALGGSFTLFADGSFDYQPDTNWFGIDSFTYQATDGTLFSNIGTATIHVLPVNDTPVAVDDFYTVGEDHTFFGAFPGVLVNDFDADGGPLFATLIDGPEHGSMTLNSDGSFTYVPDPNWFGVELMSYQAWDGGYLVGSASNIAFITITVNPLPDLPIANNDAYSLLEDTTLTIASPGILLNDINPDSLLPAAPYAGLVPTVVNGPLHGSLTVNANGSFSYTPNANYFGTDFYTYYVTNATGTSLTATVNLTIVNTPEAPIANNDVFQTNEDVTLVIGPPGVLWNDNNPDSTTGSGFLGLSAMLINGPLFGTVLLAPDGSFVYTPHANFFGVDTFTYTALNQAGLPDLTPATVTINVLSVPDAPVARDNFYVMDEDSTLTVPAPGILGNDFDPDNLFPGTSLPFAGLTAVLVNTTQNGTLTLNSNGSFTYVPFPGVSGVDFDSFTYLAQDASGLYSNLARVVITIREIPETTVTLAASSDTGCSPDDRITNDNTPTFFGTTVAFAGVSLFAQLEGSGIIAIVGTTIADSNGFYSITSNPLADGQYTFFVEAFRPPPPGNPVQSLGIVNAGTLLIDTVAPVVTGAVLNPRSSQVYVGFQDNASGMCVPTLANIGNYSFSALHNKSPRALAISNAQVQPAASPTSEQVVVLRVAKKHKLGQGRYLFAIISGGVADVAGNALDGEFNGSFPSGDGAAGGNFLSEFKIGHGKNPAVATPTSSFVPILTQPGSNPSLGGIKPGGPASLLKKAKGKK